MTTINRELKSHFKANAGVKDIVGRGLIYNDNVAIIELIKNSKDASSKKVILSMNDIIATPSVLPDFLASPEIIIKDFGMGMSKEDIQEKWLNIAFSEKKNRSDQVYAGNKGVGRFSCDRLGDKLDLYTRTKLGEYLKLTIDWTLFENKGRDDEISSIPLIIEVLDESVFLDAISEDDFDSGTVLIIKNLRSNWNEQKIKKLLAEIEKFSPSLDDDFNVYFSSNVDFKDKELKKRNNAKVNNNILDKLAFKTTYIKSSIDKDGMYLETTLFFQGEIVYLYKAVNPYSSLKNISVEVHYLDTMSKSYFTRSFGIKPNAYGSVFLFYNSFRISPYGNEKNDWLGLDQRKSQGTSRNLGTRDIIGRIDISDSDDTFSVITSREGLAHNDSYFELVAYDHEDQVTLKNGKKEYGYVSTIIRQLENFVVNGIGWNRLIDRHGKQKVVSADDLIRDPKRFTIRNLSEENVLAELKKALKSNFDYIDFDIDENIVSMIQEINEDKYIKFLDDFVTTTEDKALSELNPREKGIVKKIVQASQKQVEEASKKVEQASKEVQAAQSETAKVEKSLKIEQKKQAYLLATRRTLSPDADGLIHTIKLNSVEINEGLEYLLDSIEYEELSKEELINKLSAIKLYSVKNLKMAELVTRSGFDKDIDLRSVDVVQYIFEYLEIYKNNIEIDFTGSDISFTRSISVLNLSIIMDNILSNASKWGASQMKFSFAEDEGTLVLLMSDDGEGMSELFIDRPEQIFELGARDEPSNSIQGSGIGLHHTKELLKGMNATISFVGNDKLLPGACFKVVFK
ncbi:ATP-binding protein [Ferrimonas pelagia]|uniref:ATP-binding protein n=1 Tax=Ferrimonas pelagia TaxID=1177826 RepID=A0ABP9EA94_9GAMM